MNGLSFRSITAALAGLMLSGSAAWAAVMPMDVADLTTEANKIAIGDVVEVTSFWTADQSLIKSRVVVQVDDYLKFFGQPEPTLEGEAPVNQEVLELSGGTVGDVTLTVSVLPMFEVGDRVLLFLDDHETRLVGCYQGAYLTDGDLALPIAPGCDRGRIGDYRPLADLLEEIAGALPPELAAHASMEAITPYHGDFVLPLPAMRYALCGGDWTYKPNPMGEPYVVNGNCTDASAGTPAEQVTQINKGPAAWNNAGADFAFTYGGTSSGTSVTYNGINLVFFSNNPPDGGGYVAATYIWSSGGNISECDLVFNDLNYNWWNGQGGCSFMFDIWNVATHEFGHFLCLADLYGGGDSAKTMYGYVSYCQTGARTLHADDIAGIQAIYGVAAPYCGDGTCDPDEDQCSCPDDCGVPPSTESNCTDSVDNDCDSNTDCADVDCADDPACGPYCGDGTCDPGEDQCSCADDCGNPPSTESNCTDGLDNDCDGKTDTADPDCAGPGCPYTCGDIDGSGGSVDLNDFATLANCYGLGSPAGDCDATSLACSDMDGDGTVNLSDFSTFALVYGLTSPNLPPTCP
jgi:hypothetical protein